jgi:hypothetical protein
LGVLIERKSLNEKELEIVEFVKKFEAAYPCTAYEHAKKSIQPFRDLKLNWYAVAKSDKNENFVCKDLVKLGEKSSALQLADLTPNSSRYSHPVIEWIRDWSPKAQAEILAESLIVNKGISSCL